MCFLGWKKERNVNYHHNLYFCNLHYLISYLDGTQLMRNMRAQYIVRELYYLLDLRTELKDFS